MHSYLKNGTAACRYSSYQPRIKDAQLQYQKASVANSTAIRSSDPLESLMYNSQITLFCHLCSFLAACFVQNYAYATSHFLFQMEPLDNYFNHSIRISFFFLYFAYIFLCYKGICFVL